MLMEEKNYNFNDEDLRFKDLTKMLQDLPKVTADDNFEFNLLTKIQNGNYNAAKFKENKIGWAWIYAPATALVFSAVLIFFVFNPEYEDFDNPLLTNPPLRTALISNIPDTMIINSTSGIAENNLSPNQKSSASIKSKETENSYVAVFQPNDVVIKEKIPYPFEQGVDLDNYVGQNGLQGQSRSQLAAYGNYFDFDGFLVRKNLNKEKAMLEKARLDSLQKAQETE